VFVRCVHWRVHGIERQIEQEGTRLLAPDEVHRASGERVGEIRHGGRRLSPIENRIDALRSGVHIRMLAAEEPEELVEASRHGMKLLACAKMPLAEDSSPVAGRPQPIRKSRFTQWQAELAPRADVEFMPEPLWVAPGQQSGARRAAIRTGDIRIGEADSSLCQRVDARRRNVLAAVNADIGVTHVVCHEQHNVWRPGLSQRDWFAPRKERDDNDDGRHASNS
jgi:hypothetical protein